MPINDSTESKGFTNSAIESSPIAQSNEDMAKFRILNPGTKCATNIQDMFAQGCIDFGLTPSLYAKSEVGLLNSLPKTKATQEIKHTKFLRLMFNMFQSP